MKNKNIKLIYFGRLVDWKRVDWIIDAFNILCREFDNISLDIYGDGPIKNKLIKYSCLNKKIRFCSYNGNILKELKNYDISILASLEEPFGRSVVESIINELVLVASKSGSLPEISPIKDLLFSRDDFDDLVVKLRTALKNLDYYKYIVRNVKQEFKEYFSIARCAKEYNDYLYDK